MQVLAGAWLCLSASAAEAPDRLERTDAFDQAFAASFYHFDACGDGLSGRIYRRALTERFAQCPFSADARTRFKQRSSAQFRKSRDMIAKLIDEGGGLPVRLEGMTRTCREQMDSPEYRAIRAGLEDYGAAKAGAESVVAAACDATEIVP
jgi:hypothetical protein